MIFSNVSIFWPIDFNFWRMFRISDFWPRIFDKCFEIWIARTNFLSNVSEFGHTCLESKRMFRVLDAWGVILSECSVLFASYVAVGDEGGALRAPPSSVDIWGKKYETFAQNHIPLAKNSKHSRFPKACKHKIRNIRQKSQPSKQKFETFALFKVTKTQNSKHSSKKSAEGPKIRYIRKNRVFTTIWRNFLLEILDSSAIRIVSNTFEYPPSGGGRWLKHSLAMVGFAWGVTEHSLGLRDPDQW